MHIDDEAPAYGLHALPEADQIAVEAHAKHCPPCKQLLDQTFDTSQMLALAVSPTPPPSWCKRSLEERIERERFLNVPGRAPVTRSSWLLWVPLAAVLAVLVGWNTNLQSEMTATRHQLATAQAGYASLRTAVQQTGAIEATLAESHVGRPLQLKDAALGPVQAKMYMVPGESQGLMIVRNLPPPPAGKVYGVWVARENLQQRCGTFMNESPIQSVMVHAPEALNNYKWIMITLEDRGATPAQPQNSLLFGDL
ncbi:MAG: hypothetical protein NVS4B8_27550 [Herpetosiphon sp.]